MRLIQLPLSPPLLAAGFDCAACPAFIFPADAGVLAAGFAGALAAGVRETVLPAVFFAFCVRTCEGTGFLLAAVCGLTEGGAGFFAGVLGCARTGAGTGFFCPVVVFVAVRVAMVKSDLMRCLDS